MMFDDSVLGGILLILLLALAFLFLYNVIRWCAGYPETETETMVNIQPLEKPTWERNRCPYLIGETMEKVLAENRITPSETGSPSPPILLPCGYDDIDREIGMMDPQPGQRVFIVHNADELAGKDHLWRNLVRYHTLAKAKTLMPNTYILYSPDDMARFEKEYTPGKLYIMKKNIQRQEGLKIVDSYDEVIRNKRDYVVVQELLQDPYTIAKRKINMRFYVLVVCNGRNVDVYVYKDGGGGFMYYTKDPWVKHSKELGPNITTGYIDRKVYEQNPLTHDDLRKYLDDPRRPLSEVEERIRDQGKKVSDVFFDKIYRLLAQVFVATSDKICDGDKLRDAISFQQFGADVAMSDTLVPHVMEVNKGCNISPHSPEDAKVKEGFVRDTLRLIGAIDNPGANGFIKIVDREGMRITTI